MGDSFHVAHLVAVHKIPDRPVMARMNFDPGVHLVEILDLDSVRDGCRERGIRLFEIGDVAIVDRTSFFSAMRATFPLDPPLVRYDNWDALDDSLSNGFILLEAPNVAVAWKGARTMQLASPGEFEIAIEMFVSASAVLGTPEYTAGKPIDLTVFVECRPSR